MWNSLFHPEPWELFTNVKASRNGMPNSGESVVEFVETVRPDTCAYTVLVPAPTRVERALPKLHLLLLHRFIAPSVAPASVVNLLCCIVFLLHLHPLHSVAPPACTFYNGICYTTSNGKQKNSGGGGSLRSSSRSIYEAPSRLLAKKAASYSDSKLANTFSDFVEAIFADT
jgi:hypothetical protein